MKRLTFIISLSALLLIETRLSAQQYEYPFQNPDLPEEERVENLLSLMTLEEKVATFSGLGVPRLAVPKGQTVAVTLDVPEEDLMLWDMDKHAFMLNKGESKFMVGASSADIRLTETVKLK